MPASLRLIPLLFAAFALPVPAAAQPGTAGQPAATSSFKARADAALARYNTANSACDDAGKRAAAEELNALADEARTQLSTVRAAGQFAQVALAQAQKDVSDVTLAIEAARALPRVNCPPGRQPVAPQPGPAPGAAPQPAPGTAPQPTPRPAREDDDEDGPAQLAIGGRVFQAIGNLENAADACDLAEMDRQLAILEELVAEGRRAIQAARAAGQFGTMDIPKAQRELEAAEGYRDIGRRIVASNRERCLREGPRRPHVPMPLRLGEREPAPPPPANIMDPNFRDEGTEQAREAAADYEEARLACDDEGMRAARLRLERHLETAEEVAAYGATVQGTDARTLRLKEIANNRVRDIRALLDGLRGVPVNCPSETATPAPPPPTPPPAEPPVVPRQRAIRGLFGAAGVGWLKEGETGIGFASLGGGYRFGDHFGIEGEGAIGLIDEENESGAFRDAFGIDFDLAAYATLYVPVAGNADLFARAGYGMTRFSFTAEGPGFDFEDSTSDGSFRYGLGGQVFFDEANGVRATWTRWDEFEAEGIDADVFVISYVRRFGGAG